LILAITGSEEAVLPNGLSLTATTGNALGKTGTEVPAPGASQFEYLPADLMGSRSFDDQSEVLEKGHEFRGGNK
jgi:hypothetical protein